VQIILQSQNGDQDAFAALFEQYKNLVYRTAYLMLNDGIEAEDALQDVFVQVYKGLPNYDPQKGAFTTWLYRITIRYCLNHRRKKRMDYQPLNETTVVASVWMEVEDNEMLQQAIDQLKPKLRAVIVLRYYWDLPYNEIAQVLEIPLGTVKSRLNQALKNLRHMLANPAVVSWLDRSTSQEVE
jgi:RNA polymerase sigma-70 factor (ECF subfamily)